MHGNEWSRALEYEKQNCALFSVNSISEATRCRNSIITYGVIRNIELITQHLGGTTHSCHTLQFTMIACHDRLAEIKPERAHEIRASHYVLRHGDVIGELPGRQTIDRQTEGTLPIHRKLTISIEALVRCIVNSI